MDTGALPAETDVAIVGAGPSGLALAGDLAAAGVRATVLERRGRESNLTRAFGVHARTLELFDARGLADELITTGTPIRHLRLFDRVDVDLGVLRSRFPFLLITPQYHVETLLSRRAERFGATLVRGVEVTGLSQDTDGVEVRTAAGQTIRASYAVGADGVNSRVRDALGLPFPGAPIIESIMLADVRLADPPEDVLSVNAVGDCFAFVAPFGDGWYRVFAWDRRNPQPDDAPLSFEEVRDVTARALGVDFGMHDPRWMSRFHSDERQVPSYRVGRVFLAGDAAHVHSPAGGQGMNTGIQDGCALGRAFAEDALDGYEPQRRPVAQRVVAFTDRMTRMATLRRRPARAARNAVLPLATRVPALRNRLVRELAELDYR